MITLQITKKTIKTAALIGLVVLLAFTLQSVLFYFAFFYDPVAISLGGTIVDTHIERDVWGRIVFTGYTVHFPDEVTPEMIEEAYARREQGRVSPGPG